jgi:drug/metabolite transporter (DMT)-like permease
MRLLLLFYLAPLWTVLLARIILHEKLTLAGVVLVGLSLAGAAVMLWRPELGAPWPNASGEWIGLAAGFLFALANVLIRRAHHYTIELKSMAVFVGVVVVGLGYVAIAEPLAVPRAGGDIWLLVAGVGVVLLVINLVVQYGLTRISAGRAIVILLSELAVAALAAWWLAGETMGPREWLGGALIVAASLISAKLDA